MSRTLPLLFSLALLALLVSSVSSSDLNDLPSGMETVNQHDSSGKRFTYTDPASAVCSAVNSTDLAECFSYYKDDTDQRWYMENCCACAVEAHFNMVNPENQPTAQLPDWVLFSQGSLAAGQKWHLFFMDDNPLFQPSLNYAELANC